MRLDPLSSPLRAVTSPGVAPTGPLPPGVAAPRTADEVALYEQAKEFEGVFVKQLVSQMLSAARGDGAAAGAEALYQDMADETMTRSLVDGGTFGLAGTLYGFMHRTGASPAAAGDEGGDAR